MLILERRVEAARRRVEAGEAALTEARQAWESGNVLRLRLLEAEAQLLQAKQALVAAQFGLQDAQAALRDLLGLPLNEPLALAPPTDAPAEAPALETLLREAHERRPELRSAIAQVEKARAGVQAAQADWLPEVSVFAQHVWQSGVPFLARNNGLVGAKLTFSVMDWGKRKAQLGERRALLAQAEENLRRLRTATEVEVEKAYRKMERLRQLQETAAKAVELRREARRISGDQVELGLATARTLKEVEAALMESESQQLEADLGYRLSMAELNRAAGR